MAQNIWAPWRMEFIKGQREKGCIFCRCLSEGEGRHGDNFVLTVRPRAFVMLNRYPYTAGHLMVIPKRHVGDLSDLPAEEYADLWELVRESAKALERAIAPQGLNLGVNLGASAGAGILDHLHVHLVPRWVGDTNFMPVLGDVHVMPEYLSKTWSTLRPFFEPPERASR